MLLSDQSISNHCLQLLVHFVDTENIICLSCYIRKYYFADAEDIISFLEKGGFHLITTFIFPTYKKMKQIVITIIFIIIIIFVVTMIILKTLFGKRGGLTAGDLDRKQWVDLVGGGAFLITILKGESRPNL